MSAPGRIGGLEGSAELVHDRGVLAQRLRDLRRELLGAARRAAEARPEVRPEAGPEATEARLSDLLTLVGEEQRSPDSLRDAVSTSLMDLYRIHESRGAFGLLYELNRGPLLQQVAARLRRYQSKADPSDVLHEVFFNVYRYPHRFDSQREDAFRVWTATIVRNTVLKHLRSLSRSGRAEVPFEDLSEHPEQGGRSPLGGAIDRESESECHRVYLTYLHLYLRFYSMLSERERRAIHLVEVDECSYREAAAELGIKLENLKMVIFRARRKIHRAMRRVFEGLPPDCRPARDPRSAGAGTAADRDAEGRGSGRQAEADYVLTPARRQDAGRRSKLRRSAVSRESGETMSRGGSRGSDAKS